MLPRYRAGWNLPGGWALTQAPNPGRRQRPRVLDDQAKPIAGLDAAGNDMTSVMGGTYPGASITIGPALTFSYIAARHAVSSAGR